MDLTNLSNQELTLRLEKLAASERKITHVILWYINEMESRRSYAELGFSSVYDYLTKHLGYGESSAYRRIQSARLLKQIPHLAEKIESGALNLTQLTQVQKCIKQESKAGRTVSLQQTEQVLELITNSTSFETQKHLAVEFNQPIQVVDSIKPQQDGSVILANSFSEDEILELQQVRDLLSHAVPDGSLRDVIMYLARKEIKRVTGKSSEQKSSEIPLKSEGRDTKQVSGRRKYINVATKRSLMAIAKGCCEYQDPKTGNRCTSRYQLQRDHRIPFSKGGGDQISNLRMLCRTHNLLAARQAGLN